MINTPGRWVFGQIGPYGSSGLYGKYCEPDYAPELYPIYSPPTQSEISALLQKRLQIYNNYCAPGSHSTDSYVVEQEGVTVCLPAPNNQFSLYDVAIVSHTVELNGNSYIHYAFVRFPLSIPPPVNPKIIVLCHGGAPDDTWGWSYMWNYMKYASTNSIHMNALLVFPCYFSFMLNTDASDNTEGVSPECGGLYPYGTADIGVKTAATQSEMQDDLDALGFTIMDANSIAILQLINALRDHGVTNSNEVAFFGSSFGGGTTYHTATLLPTTGTDVICKAAVVCFGGTDWFAPWRVRESLRYAGSRRLFDGQENASYMKPFVEQFIQADVENYLQLLLQYSPEPPPDQLVTAERMRKLDRSVVHYWDYDARNPLPLQVHHGTKDLTVTVENSRWLAENMKDRAPDAPFEYYENEGADHFMSELSSLDHAGPWIETYLNP